MKKVFVLVLASLCFFSACKKTKNAGVQAAGKTHGIEDSNIRFVCLREGIPLEKTPGLDSELIRILENKEKVEIISQSQMMSQIGMRYSNWVEVKTKDNLVGFVFDGYLEKNLEDLKLVQKIEGKYADPNGENFVIIEKEVNQKFRVTSDYPDFEKYAFIKQDEVYTKDLFYKDKKGNKPASSLKFDKKGKLVFRTFKKQNEFEDVILKKVSDVPWEYPDIRQEYKDSLSSEESKENYKEIFFSLDSARDYIFKNYDSYNSEDMKYFYKENYYWATTVVLVNNEISNNSRIKIGTAKKDVYDLLGIPWRIIRRENKDYFEYGYEDETNSISTSLGFYFDKNGFISEVQIYKEYFQE